MEPVIREEAHRNQVFASLEGPGTGSKPEAVAAKRAGRNDQRKGHTS